MKNYNWEIVGQKNIVNFLQKGLTNNNLAHAYLFAGPNNLGKETLARKFMAAILCADYHQQNDLVVENIPCGQCAFCQQIAKGIHPDVFILQKEEETKNISIEQVREMQKFLNLTSFLNSYKIALVKNAEDLNINSQNALLKVLEEPAKKTILILLVKDANLLLPTILSRCQVFKFLPVANEEIFQHLLKIGLSREQARVYSALACGRIGLAMNFAADSESYQTNLENTQKFFDLLDLNLAGRFKLVENMLASLESSMEKSSFLIEQLTSWQIILRDILFLQNNLDYLVVNLHFQDRLKQLAGKYQISRILNLLAKFKKVEKLLSININPRLAVENLVINF